MRRALGAVMFVTAVVLVVAATGIARADPVVALPPDEVASFREKLWRHVETLGPVEGLRAGEVTVMRAVVRCYSGIMQAELRTFEGADGPARALAFARDRLQDQLRAGRRLKAGALEPEATANGWVEVRGAQVVVARLPRAIDQAHRIMLLMHDLGGVAATMWRAAGVERVRPVWMALLQEDGTLVVAVDRDVEASLDGLAGALAEAGLQPRTTPGAEEAGLSLHAWPSPSRHRIELVLVDRACSSSCRGLIDALTPGR